MGVPDLLGGGGVGCLVFHDWGTTIISDLCTEFCGYYFHSLTLAIKSVQKVINHESF